MNRAMQWLTVVGGLMSVMPAAAAAQATRERPVRVAVEDAFFSRADRALGLDDAQSARLKTVLTEWGAKRRAIETEERELVSQLSRELRPGVAADNAKVTATITKLLAARVSYAESFQGEMRDLEAFLTPAQRGQFLTMRDMVFRNVRALQERRTNDGVPVQAGVERRRAEAPVRVGRP